jgi:hypothetical protein
VLENDGLFIPKRPPSPPQIRVSKEELNRMKDKNQAKERDRPSGSVKIIKQEYVSTPSPSTPTKRRNSELLFDTTPIAAKSRRFNSGRKVILIDNRGHVLFL